MNKIEKTHFKKFYSTGRRKTSSARVWILKGTGQIQVNKKSLNTYFSRITLHSMIKKPLNIIQSLYQFDIIATVKGGGISSQASAIIYGIARAILKYNEKYRSIFKKHGLITRDSRVVERKKYGQAGARKKFQYSKR